MDRLSVARLGFAIGALFAALYGANMVIVMAGLHDTVVVFFDSILHGIDVGSIMRWNMPWWEMVVGLIEVFILGWLCGMATAIFYKLGRY